MREIIFDTETTGLRHADGDRVIEIGAVELENRFPTGRNFHVYINPQGQTVHPEAYAVHGISNDDLGDKPPFADIVADFVAFVGEGHLIAHNASFDMAFINAEFSRLDMPSFPTERVIDTLALARRKHPMGPNSLDALCSRYNVDNAHRTKHGALLDAELLAEVYIEMNGGRQAALLLDPATTESESSESETADIRITGKRPVPLPSRLDDGNLRRHGNFIKTLGEDALWKRYSAPE